MVQRALRRVLINPIHDNVVRHSRHGDRLVAARHLSVFRRVAMMTVTLTPQLSLI
jgi:hypothetical protein